MSHVSVFRMDARTRYVADRIAQKFSLHDKAVVDKFLTQASVAEVLGDFFSANGRPSLTVYFQPPQKGEPRSEPKRAALRARPVPVIPSVVPCTRTA